MNNSTEINNNTSGSEVTTTIATILIDESDPGKNETFTESVNNTLSDFSEDPELELTFEVLTILSIIMMIAELFLTIMAIAKLKQWRRNYRNLLLTQISLARLLQCIIGYAIFLEKKPNIFDPQKEPCLTYLSFIIYFNFVTIFLVFFLIKHMYNSLIVVFVKISKKHLYKVSIFAWLFPLPLTAGWVAFVVYDVFDKFLIDLIFCSLFKWTLTIIGTILYICILRKILRDKFRKFVRSLTIITFALCLVINVYMITADISRLINCKLVLTMKYIIGFILNCLVLCLYIVLVSTNFKHRIKHCDAISNYSVGAVNKELNPGNTSTGIERYSIKYEPHIMFDVDIK